MAESYQRPVARILNEDGSVVGAGFVAPRGVVITCAHVVNDALAGRDKLEPSKPEPDASVLLYLPWGGGRRHTGKIIDWRPPARPGPGASNPCIDIAVLSLNGAVPEDSAVRPQPPTAVPENTVFRVMGFPDGAADGAPFRGEVRGTDGRGWHHVEAAQAFGRTLEPGFSGAPAIGPGERLLGIVDIVNREERRGVLIPVEALIRAWPLLAEPYRGLEAFREEDEAYFFGREIFADRLWQSFERHPATLLIGPSGSGKSSLINAGFLPRVRRQEGWRVVRIRPGDRPLERLARELLTALKPGANAFELTDELEKRRDALLADPARLVRYAEALRATAQSRICLVIDQFEETFTLARTANAEQHSALLAGLAFIGSQGEQPPIKAVLGMRSDFQTLLLADDAATGLIKAIDGNPTIMLRRLDPGERESVIRGPLDHLEVSLEDGLLGRLMDEIANNPDALPLLEFALTSLWPRLRIDGQRRYLTNAAYDEIGGLSGAVAKYADGILKELNVDVGRVKRLFMELVRVSDTTEQDARRPRSKNHLDAIDEALWPLAQELAGKRLLVTTGEPAAEIVHEALFRRWGRLAGWINEDRDFLRWRQRLEDRLRDWEDSGRDPGQLLKSTMLDDAILRLEAHRDALAESEIEFLNESQKEATAERVRRQCDALWERLEFSWKLGGMPPHEVQALMDLSAAPEEVRLSFLVTATTNEARARRFNRAPGLALRAALGLDVMQAQALAGWLAEAPADFAREERRAALAAGSSVVALAPGLTARLVDLANLAMKETTDADQLPAYAQTIQVFAGRVDSATARVVIERSISAIVETTHAGQLQAYGQTIQALAGRVDSATACAAIERSVSAISETLDVDRLQAYGQTIRAFAERVDSATACAAIERSVSAISETLDVDRLQAYGQTIQAFAERVDSAMARVAIERSISAIAETLDVDQLQANGQTIRALAERVDSATARAAIERSVSAIAETTDAGQLQAYGQTICALAHKVDSATADVAARVVIERSVSGIAETTDAGQLQAYGQTICALAHKVDSATARAAIERSVSGIAETTDADQLQAYGQTIQALAERIDSATARAAIERLVSGIAETTDADQLQAYGQTIHALVDKVDSATAGAAASVAVERLGSGIAETTDADQLQAYGQTIKALAERVDSALARATIERSLFGIRQTTDADQLQAYGQTIQALAKRGYSAPVEQWISNIAGTADPHLLQAYGEMIRALAEKVDSAAAGAAVEQLVSRIARAWSSSQCEAYGEIIRALADKVGGATADVAVEQSVSGIARARSLSQRAAYGETIRALVDKVDSGTARSAAKAIVEHLGSGIADTMNGQQLQAYAKAVVSMQAHLPREAWIFVATEVLKYPVAALGDTTDSLVRAIGKAAGLPEGADSNLWDVVRWLEEGEPWLPLCRPWQPTRAIIAEFRHLLDHGPPLPPHEAPA